jgi:O-antigen/teichoic acid export membrane protein
MGDSVVNRVLTVLGSSLGTQVITILFTPILVRLLGVAAYGEYAFILSVLSISTVVTSAGTFDSARKFITERRDTVNWREHVFGVYARVVLTLSAVLVVFLVAAVQLGLIESLLDAAYVPYFYLLTLLVPLQAAFRLSRSVLMGLDLESRSEPLYVLQRLLFALLALVLVWLGWGVVGALVGRILAFAGVLVFMFVLIHRELDAPAIIQPAPLSFPRRSLLSYNISTVAFKLLVTSLYNIDIMFLGILVGSTATGSYRAALVVAQFLWLVPTAVQVGLLHSASRLWSDNEHKRISALSSRAVRFTLVFTLLLVLGVAALAEPLVSLYFGKGFTQTPETVLYLLPGVLGFAVARPVYATSQGHGNLRPVLLATGIAAALNVVLNLVLIPRYGAVGAAIATSIGYGSMVVFHIWAARALGFDPITDLRPLRIAATAAIAAIPIFGLPRLLEGDIVQLVVVPPIGFVVYMALALRTRAVDPTEVRMLVASGPISALIGMLPSRVVALLRRSLGVVIGTRL